MVLLVKSLPAHAGDVRESGSIPGLGKHANPLQYSCLENPMDRGAWRVTVHGVCVGHDRSDLARTHIHDFYLGN